MVSDPGYKIVETLRDTRQLPKPNKPCHCGSGRKYKKCCMRRDALPPDERDLLDPGPVPRHVKDATDKMLVEEGYIVDIARRLRALVQVKRCRAVGAVAAALLWTGIALG